MTSGRRHLVPRRTDVASAILTQRRWFALAAACVLAMGAGVPAMAVEWNVAKLMQSLAQQKGGRVTFVERKYIAILDRPVESSGELVYQPPARLEKRTLLPKPESLVLDGDVLVAERGRQSYTLQLQQYPEVTAIVDSIRGTLGGDLMALERHYRVELRGTPEAWTLTLLPSDPQVGAIVTRIDMSGAGNVLRQIEMLQSDGDRSVMTIGRAPLR